jgi:CheY-like chemotaxis protein
MAQARMGAPAHRLAERVVLVVDDEAAVRRYIARVLGDAGFRVLEAADGSAAAALLASLGTTLIGLVVSDISMPGMSGVELAAVIGEHWPTVPIVLTSGQGGPPTGYGGPFLAKPFGPDALVTVVLDLVSPVEAERASAARSDLAL